VHDKFGSLRCTLHFFFFAARARAKSQKANEKNVRRTIEHVFLLGDRRIELFILAVLRYRR
jgi:hypothetical protein